MWLHQCNLQYEAVQKEYKRALKTAADSLLEHVHVEQKPWVALTADERLAYANGDGAKGVRFFFRLYFDLIFSAFF